MTFKPDLSNLDHILEQEKISRKSLIFINQEELMGEWYLKFLWRNKQKAIINNLILRLFKAKLKLSRVSNKDNIYNIENTLGLCQFSITFLGLGEFIENNSKYTFNFDNLIISFFNIEIYSKVMPVLPSSSKPFFKFIYLDNDNKLLAARGKGGGIATWEKKVDL